MLKKKMLKYIYIYIYIFEEKQEVKEVEEEK